jgi:hypothetical protein
MKAKQIHAALLKTWGDAVIEKIGTQGRHGDILALYKNSDTGETVITKSIVVNETDEEFAALKERIDGLDYCVDCAPNKWNDEHSEIARVAAQIMARKIEKAFPWVSATTGLNIAQDAHEPIDAFVEDNSYACIKEATDKFVIVRKGDVGLFITPRQCQGQIVTCSYCRTWDFIIERSEDASDRMTTYTAYKFTSKKQSPAEDDSEFENNLQMYAPELGRRIGEVLIK